MPVYVAPVVRLPTITRLIRAHSSGSGAGTPVEVIPPNLYLRADGSKAAGQTPPAGARLIAFATGVMALNLSTTDAYGSSSTDGTTGSAPSAQVIASTTGSATPTFAWTRADSGGTDFAISDATAANPVFSIPSGTDAFDGTQYWRCDAVAGDEADSEIVKVRLVRTLNAPPAPVSGVVSHQMYDTDLTDATGKGWAYSPSGSASVVSGELRVSGGGYIETPDHADWDLGAGEFTIEQRVKFNVATSNVGLISQWGATTAECSWALYMYSGALYLRFYDPAGGAFRDTGDAWAPTPGTVYELAADRDAGGTVRVYVDGVVLASASFPQAVQAVAAPVRIGGVRGFSGFELDGAVQWSRVIKGDALYGGAYNPSMGTGGNGQASALDVTPAQITASGNRGDTLTAQATANQSGGEWSWASGGQFMQIVDPTANPVTVSSTTAASTQSATRTGWLRYTLGQASVDRYVEFYFQGTEDVPL